MGELTAGLSGERPAGRLRRCLLATMVLGLVVACSDPDQPSTLPSDTPTTSSTSASPTPATPKEQVEAAVRTYYAELQRAAQSSDTSTLRTMMTRTCPCYRAVKVLNQNKRQGETAPDSKIELQSVRVRQLEGPTASAEVRLTASAYDVIDRGGEVVERVAAQEAHWDLSVIRTPQGAWVIANLFDLEG